MVLITKINTLDDRTRDDEVEKKLEEDPGREDQEHLEAKHRLDKGKRTIGKGV